MQTLTQPRASTALSTTEYAVLGLLLDGPKSGYDLKRGAERGVGHVWTPAKSQIYVVLPRLVEAGYATSRRVRQDGRPDKQLYRITKSGEQALREWLVEPVEEGPGRTPFLLKIFFGRLMSREALTAHIERKREQAEDALAEYLRIEERIRDSDKDYFGYLTLRYGLAEARAWISWADEVLAELEERA